MMDWNWGWGAMMAGGLGMLVFWGLVLGLVVWAVRGFGGSNPQHPPSSTQPGSQPTALEILQARYARGEISREEYETIRRDLQSS